MTVEAGGQPEPATGLYPLDDPDGHRWVRPTNPDCPDCLCCTITLCETARNRGEECMAVLDRSEPSLLSTATVPCPCTIGGDSSG